jgi:hypothetical protein
MAAGTVVDAAFAARPFSINLQIKRQQLMRH